MLQAVLLNPYDADTVSTAYSSRVSRNAHLSLVVYYRAWHPIFSSLLSLVSLSRPVSFPATRELQLRREGWMAGECSEERCMRRRPYCQSTFDLLEPPSARLAHWDVSLFWRTA